MDHCSRFGQAAERRQNGRFLALEGGGPVQQLVSVIKTEKQGVVVIVPPTFWASFHTLLFCMVANGRLSQSTARREILETNLDRLYTNSTLSPYPGTTTFQPKLSRMCPAIASAACGSP